MITIFKSMDSHGTPEYFEIDEVLGRIKRGVNRALIEQIRKTTDKNQRDPLKKKLLWICFSGEFTARLNDALISHSGFICLDFDGMNEKELAYWRSRVKADKHTYCVFTSPSGNGLKALWKIPICESNDEHNRRFNAIAEYWKDCKFFDKNVKGWNRVCFESYDPDLVINHNSVIFEDIDDEVRVENTKPYRQITDETDEIFKRIVTWFERSHSLGRGNRDKGAFVFASGVADYIPESTGFNLAVNYIMQNVEQVPGDTFTLAEAEKCVRNAYKNHPYPKKSFDLNGRSQPTSYTPVKKTVSALMPISNDFEPDPEPEQSEDPAIFWYRTPKGALKLCFHSLKIYLQKCGFFRYEFVPEKVNFIRIEKNVIESVTAIDIKNFILNKLDSWGETDVYNLVAEHTKFKDEYLSLLDVKTPQFLEDSQNVSWFFFRNTAVKVTGEVVEEIPYIDIDGCIWKSSKLDRDFMITGYDECDFSKFLWNVCDSNQQRLRALCSSLGYLLHRHKSASNVKGIVFYEEQISDKPVGGTGKTLIFQALGHLRELVTIDAKSYDNNNQFALQRVQPSTNIVMWDDLPRNFKYEVLFSKMSTGLPINKKNKAEIYLPFKKSPKFCFPSNYIIKGESSSFKRRKFEIEIHPYYSDEHQPIDDFNREFWGEEWQESDWMMFDNLMLNCCRLFLSEGLINPEYVNLEDKKFIAQTSEEFAEWAAENLTNNERYHRSDTYRDFSKVATESKAYCPTARIFYDWLRLWGEHKKWQVTDATGAGRMYIEYGQAVGKTNLVDEWYK
jgi:hypothetical protein